MKAFGRYISVRKHKENAKMGGTGLELSAAETSSMSIQRGVVETVSGEVRGVVRAGDTVFYNKSKEVTFKDDDDKTVIMVVIDAVIAVAPVEAP